MRRFQTAKYFLRFVYIISALLVLISTVILIVNTNDNKGILPIIFFLILVFYISFMFNQFSTSHYNSNDSDNKKSNYILPIEILKIILSVILFLISIFVLWI